MESGIPLTRNGGMFCFGQDTFGWVPGTIPPFLCRFVFLGLLKLNDQFEQLFRRDRFSQKETGKDGNPDHGIVDDAGFDG